jgi:hypothetical protein
VPGQGSNFIVELPYVAGDDMGQRSLK